MYRIESTIIERLKAKGLNATDLLRIYFNVTNCVVYSDQFVNDMIEEYRNTSAAIIYHMLKGMGVVITEEMADRMRAHFDDYDEVINGYK